MSSPEKLLRKVFPPMLATLASEPPADDANWIYETKYDGFRALTAIAGGRMAMWSRNELDLAPRFPLIAEAMKKIKVKDAVLDGEIVALDDKGVPRFQLLQQGEQREVIFIFDLLWLDGRDLRNQSYEQRRAALEKLLRRPPARVRLSEQIALPGREALKRAAARGEEGIVAKRKTSMYEGRRSKEWLKVKALNEQEFIIVGWQPSTHSSKEIGSLHLAVRGDDGELHYAGKVGTGFSAKMRVWLKDELSKDVVPQKIVSDAPRIRDATWVRPRLVGQVAFTEWTADNRLRHPSFLGLREDKAPEDVVREKPMTKSEQRAASGDRRSAPARRAPLPARQVTLTHPERVLYPKDKITKQDVADYYDAVAEPMIRALRDRPLTLEHWNDGIGKPSWFHQNIGREGPSWLHTIETPTRASSRKSVRHLVGDNRETLRWLAQMSVLTVHMWSSRGESLNEPDWFVFDLDPAKGKGIEQAIDAAIVIRGLLENLQFPGVPKTSGKRGIHVFVPLAPGYTHEQAADFACSISAAVAKQVPYITVERSIASRRGRLYLDCLQNGYGKTMVAPYSLRAIDGAPVSAPLKWEEIDKKLDPKKFNLRTMPERLAKVGDLFEAIFRKRAKLPELK
ncbi:MAG TPA: DNA ligase D [Thermoanaerobaculia bacterium]|nr:DNA ligase D [Thermoanaerobaculia bacterium]